MSDSKPLSDEALTAIRKAQDYGQVSSRHERFLLLAEVDRLRAENARLQERRREDTFIIAERNAENARLQRELETLKRLVAERVESDDAYINRCRDENARQAETIARLREAMRAAIEAPADYGTGGTPWWIVLREALKEGT